MKLFSMIRDLWNLVWHGEPLPPAEAPKPVTPPSRSQRVPSIPARPVASRPTDPSPHVSASSVGPEDPMWLINPLNPLSPLYIGLQGNPANDDAPRSHEPVDHQHHHSSHQMQEPVSAPEPASPDVPVSNDTSSSYSSVDSSSSYSSSDSSSSYSSDSSSSYSDSSSSSGGGSSDY